MMASRTSLTSQLLLCSALVGVACLGLRASFGGWGFLVAVVVGSGVGFAASEIGRRRSLLLGETLAVSLVLFVLAGVVLGGVAEPGTFADGLINGWADLLSSSPPAVLTPTLRIVPFTIAWLGVTASGALLRRSTTASSAMAGPVLALILSLLLSVEDRPIAVTQGVAIAVGAVLLGVVDRSTTPASSVGGGRKAVALGAGMLLAVAAIAAYVGPKLPLAGDRDRFDLRAYQDRQWNPLDEPSPLVTFKASLKQGQSDEQLFVVRSLTPITRFASATLSSYTGTVWTVADVEATSVSRFTPVDYRFPQNGSPDGETVAFEVEVLAAGAPWVPLTGWPVEIERIDGPSNQQRLRFNAATGTVADPAGLSVGETFAISALVTPAPSLSELGRLTAVSNSEDAGELSLVPPSFRNTAGDVFEGVDAGTPRAVALSHSFVNNGFYDHTTIARPGHSLARLDEFFEDPDKLVGYGEQYAAGAAVLARIGGLPARVVVGYEVPSERYVDGEAIVIADDIAAWIEIETVELGWVSVDVTPDRSREPEQNTVGRSIQEVAIPNPPPPPSPPPELPLPSQATETDQKADEADKTQPPRRLLGDYQWVAVASAGLLFPVAAIGCAGLAVVGLKWRRRRNRAMAGTTRDRIAGAWRELCDRFTESGVDQRSTTTPSETATATLAALDMVDGLKEPVTRLALAVDRAAFHPHEPDNAAADAAWSDYETAAACLVRSRGAGSRILRASNPRPLRRRRNGARSTTEGSQHV